MVLADNHHDLITVPSVGGDKVSLIISNRSMGHSMIDRNKDLNVYCVIFIIELLSKSHLGYGSRTLQ